MCRSLLVYDGSNRLFRAVGDAVADRLKLRAVPWSSEPSQAFLDAQFGGQPFVFVLVEDDSVHVGDAAVEQLLRKTVLTDSITRLLTRSYPPIAGPLGRVIHGRRPADIHGSFPLDAEAAGHLEALRQECPSS